MSRLKQIFEVKKPLITYITAGDPNLRKTKKIVFKLEKAGVDIIELGIPFSDPLADGPTIQVSHQKALKSGTSLKKILALVKDIRKKSKVPLVLMGAANLFLAYGLKEFFAEAGEVGIDGLIIPDLTPEESKDFLYLSDNYNIDLIFLAAPTSSDYRLGLIAKVSNSFIYLVSSTGLTGERDELAYDEIEKTITKIKSHTNLPIAVGFGISNEIQVMEILKRADGVIIGSAIVKRIWKSLGNALKFVGNIIEGINENGLSTK